jgi:hypothetical protein
MEYINSLKSCVFEKSEVSKMEWKTIDNCMKSIRPYNVEKKRILEKIHSAIIQNIII